MQENSANYVTNEKTKRTLKLVDIPGYDRLRQQFFNKFKSNARGIIFIIDSVTFQREIKDVAEMIHNVLTDRTTSSTAPAVLIACNKHDQALAKGAKLIQTSLEKELNAARLSKSASLAATDGSLNGSVFLGKRSQDFTFADVKQYRVEFIECSARGGRDSDDTQGLRGVQEWIAKIS